MKGKRGISVVVATILLILITFLAVTLVWRFILPMLREGMEGSSSCFDLRDYAKILESEYSCYNSTSEKTLLMIERGMEDFEINGFRVSILSGAESKTYDLIQDKDGTAEGIMMHNGSSIIEIPNRGEARTYIFSISNGNRADLGIITKNEKICSMGTFNVPEC